MASLLTVPTPTRQAPRGGLLSVANVIDTADGHILQGATYVPESCDFPALTPGSCWATLNPVDENDDPILEKSFSAIGDPVTTTVSFLLHAGVECFVGPDEDFMDRANRILEFGESVALEQIVLQQLLSPASSLATETSLVNGIARAEQWLSRNYPGLGLIHMDRRQASLAMQNGSLARVKDDPNFRVETGQGVPVANGGGYGSLDGSAADPQFIYATGQVNLFRGPLTRTEAVQWTQNTQVALVERPYAVTIDCDAIAKVTVDLTP